MPWQIVGAIRMVLMTGWRAGEVLTLQRSFVDRARREARLPDTKTGHSVRPLAAETLALLDALPRLSARPTTFRRSLIARRRSRTRRWPMHSAGCARGQGSSTPAPTSSGIAS